MFSNSPNPHNSQTGPHSSRDKQQKPPTISASSATPQLPLRLNLDFTDEKSQHLFIYEQKYNMRKNDCFNLEKQKNYLQQQLQHTNAEFEKLQNKYKALNQKYQDLQQSSAGELQIHAGS
jgi:uncharacterized protein YlxW (UPF0749 family)